MPSEVAPAEITDDTPVSVRTNIRFILTVIGLAGGLLAGVYGFSQDAVASISRHNETAIQQIRSERNAEMKQYPTWSEIRELREQDQRYWDARLDQMQKDLVGEIRRSR